LPWVKVNACYLVGGGARLELESGTQRYWLTNRLRKSVPATPTPPPDAVPASWSSSHRHESINTAKSRFSQQYIFAALTPTSIRVLVAALKPGPQSAATPQRSVASGGEKKPTPVPEIADLQDLAGSRSQAQHRRNLPHRQNGPAPKTVVFEQFSLNKG
jgi:hypothetical protein